MSPIREHSSRGGAGALAVKVIVLVLLVAAGTWAYRANRSAPSMDMNMRVTSGSTPFPVVLGEVQRERIAGSATYTGSVAPLNEEDVYPRVTGRIVEMTVYPGDAVRPGQVVARLDDVELGSKVREAEAGLATAQANRAQMDADLVAAQQEVVHMDKELVQAEAEATYWRSVLARSERLFASGAISRQDYENDRSMAASYEAKQEAARAKLLQVRAMETATRKKIEAADFMVAQSRAQLKTAQVVRGYVTIASPAGGYVVKRLVAPGVLIQPGMPILKIAQIDRVRLQANVGEKDLPSIRVGSPVFVSLVAGSGAPISARVTSVAPFVDAGARTAVVEAVVDNRDRKLISGQYVTMQFTTGDRPDALAVPRSAIVRLAGSASVWVVKEDRVESRTVKTGLEGADRVEIVSGLQAGERIVVSGHESLYSGARVADASAPPAGGAGHAGHGVTATPDQAPPSASDAHRGHGVAGPETPRSPASPPGGHDGHGASVPTPAPASRHADHEGSAVPSPSQSPGSTKSGDAAGDTANPRAGHGGHERAMTPAEGKPADDPHAGMTMPGNAKEGAHAGH